MEVVEPLRRARRPRLAIGPLDLRSAKVRPHVPVRAAHKIALGLAKRLVREQDRVPGVEREEPIGHPVEHAACDRVLPRERGQLSSSVRFQSGRMGRRALSYGAPRPGTPSMARTGTRRSHRRLGVQGVSNALKCPFGPSVRYSNAYGPASSFHPRAVRLGRLAVGLSSIPPR